MKKLILATLAFCPLLLLVIWSRSYQDPTEENDIPKARDYEQDKFHVTNDIARLTRIKNDLKTVVDANSPTNVAFDAYADFFAGHKQLRGRYGETNYIEGTTVEQMRLEFKKSLDIHVVIGGRVTNIVNNFAFKPLNIVLVNATEIPTNFFMGTKVRSVVAPKVTKIGEEAFKNCPYLTYLFTSNVVEIGRDAFYNIGYDSHNNIWHQPANWEVPGGVLTRVVKDGDYISYTHMGLFKNYPIVDLKVVQSVPGHNSTVWARTFDAAWYREFPKWTWFWQGSDDEYPEKVVELYGGQAQVNEAVRQKWVALTNNWEYNGYYAAVSPTPFYMWLPACKVLKRGQGFRSTTEIESCADLVEIRAETFYRSGGTPLTCISGAASTNSVKIGTKAFYHCWINDNSLTNWFTKVRQVDGYAFSRSRGVTDLVFSNPNNGGTIAYHAFANSELKQLTFETNPEQIADTAFIRFTNKEERESTGILAAQSRHMTNVTFKACSIEDAFQVSSGSTNKWYSFLPVGCEIVATNGTYTVQESDVQSWPWHPKD